MVVTVLQTSPRAPTCRFIVAMALVTPFMAWAMELLDLRVWILRDTAWTLALMVMNFFT